MKNDASWNVLKDVCFSHNGYMWIQTTSYVFKMMIRLFPLGFIAPMMIIFIMISVFLVVVIIFIYFCYSLM